MPRGLGAAWATAELITDVQSAHLGVKSLDESHQTAGCSSSLEVPVKGHPVAFPTGEQSQIPSWKRLFWMPRPPEAAAGGCAGPDCLSPGLIQWATRSTGSGVVVLELTTQCFRLLPGFITFWEKKLFLDPLPTLNF